MNRAGSVGAAVRRLASSGFSTGLLVAAGALLTVAGTVFSLQGFGVLGGSVMTGSSFWAAAGPVIAVGGLLLVAVGARRRPAGPRR